MHDGEQHTGDVYFIAEAVADADEFGVHTRLSRAIQAALSANEHLRLVGLFGSWGSGKSTVVRFLKGDLEAQGDKVFAYDAWIHQSDAPRRAFLEALLAFLAKDGFELLKSEQKRFDVLVGRTRESVTISRPQVSWLTGIVLALLLLMPFAAQFLRNDWQDVGPIALTVGGKSFGALFVAALVLSALPALLVLILTLLRAAFQGLGFEKAGGRLVALFANKVSEERADIKTQDPEPTALEFKAYFRDLMTRYARVRRRRLTIVIDNLDRLPNEDMVSLWSSIRSLFHDDSLERTHAGDLPTVILPLDEGALKRAYKDEDVAAGFVQKTFDLVFRVPTPVISQWRSYLERQLRSVFRQTVQDRWVQVATRLMDVNPAVSPTPRAMNAFVNEIGTLWLQWNGDGVSFAAMAYYVTYRAQVEEQGWEHLRHGPSWMADFDPEWMSGVAALRYGAPPATAAQILIVEPLRKAIFANDKPAFDELSQREGFEFVLRRTVDEIRTTNAGNIKSAIHLLASHPGGHQERFRTTWLTLAQGLVQASDWKPVHADDAVAIQTLIKHCSGLGRRHVVEHFPARVEALSGDEIAAAAEHILTAVTAVRNCADQEGLGLSVIKLHAPGAIVALAEEGHEVDLSRLFQAAVQVGSVEDRLVERVSEGLGSLGLRSTCNALTAWLPDFLWNRIIAGLNAETVYDGGASERFLELFRQAWMLDPASRELIAHHARLFTPLWGGAMASAQTAARLAVLGVVSGADLPYNEVPWLPGGVEIEEVAQYAEEELEAFAPALDAVDVARLFGRFEGLDSLTRRLLEPRLKASETDFSSDSFAEAFATLLRLAPPENHRQFWGDAVSVMDLTAFAQTQPYATAALLRARHPGPTASLRQQKKGFTRLASVLEAVAVQTWEAELKAPGELLDDLKALKLSGARVNAPGLAAALTDAAPPLVQLAGGIQPTVWREACEQLPRTIQRTLYARLAEAFVQTDMRRAGKLLQDLGERALLTLLRPEHADQFFSKYVSLAIARAPEVVWLKAHIEHLAEGWPHISPETRALVHRHIRAMQGQPATQGQREAIAAFAKHLPLNPAG